MHFTKWIDLILTSIPWDGYWQNPHIRDEKTEGHMARHGGARIHTQAVWGQHLSSLLLLMSDWPMKNQHWENLTARPQKTQARARHKGTSWALPRGVLTTHPCGCGRKGSSSGPRVTADCTTRPGLFCLPCFGMSLQARKSHNPCSSFFLQADVSRGRARYKQSM